MKGFKFYLEYDDEKEKRKATRKNLGDHSGNVVAVFGEFDHVAVKDCLGAVFFVGNSDVACSTVSYDYLRENCKRISEKQAREIHPKLFARLDDGN